MLDYFDALHAHHFADSATPNRNQRLAELHGLILGHENALAAPLLAWIGERSDLRLIGKPHVGDNDRAPTIAFQPLAQSAAELTAKLQRAGIGTEHGHFYAHRLLSDLGIDPDDGVVRLSLVHYATLDEVERILRELEHALGQAA